MASDLYTLALTALDNIGVKEGKLVQRIAKCKALLIEKKMMSIDSKKRNPLKKISDSGLQFAENESSLRTTRKKNSQFTIRGGSTGTAKNQRPLSSVGTGSSLLTSQQRPSFQSASDDIDRVRLVHEEAGHQKKQLCASEVRRAGVGPGDPRVGQPVRRREEQSGCRRTARRGRCANAVSERLGGPGVQPPASSGRQRQSDQHHAAERDTESQQASGLFAADSPEEPRILCGRPRGVCPQARHSNRRVVLPHQPNGRLHPEKEGADAEDKGDQNEHAADLRRDQRGAVRAGADRRQVQDPERPVRRREAKASTGDTAEHSRREDRGRAAGSGAHIRERPEEAERPAPGLAADRHEERRKGTGLAARSDLSRRERRRPRGAVPRQLGAAERHKKESDEAEDEGAGEPSQDRLQPRRPER